MNGVRLDYQPQSVGEALALAEAHLRAIGFPHLSPTRFVRENSLKSDGTLVTASLFTNTVLREKDLLPGTRIRTGASEIEIVRTLPSEHEVVFRNKSGSLFRMTADKFVQLARQQGYRKVWDLTTFLDQLKAMLKPVVGAVPLMWIMRWVVNSVRNKPLHMEPKLTEKLEN